MAAIALTGVFVAALIPCCLRRGAPVRQFLTANHRASVPLAAQRGRYVDSIAEAAAALRGGQLVAFPTETVYGLGAHAFDASAVANIFTVKGRPRSDPLIVHVPTPVAAEELVTLDAKGLALMRRLMASFWPGPLTLVAPACPALPPAVTAGSGFVGVRCPAHDRAVELLRAAAIPVAAPSANRFGHVSPTTAEHVMDDLGAHDILVLRPAGRAAACCDVGIESTVLKLDSEARELVLLRRGGVPEAELARWLEAAQTGFTLRVQPPKHAISPPPPAASTAATDGASAAAEGDGDAGGMQAPGMLLTHYAPDLPSFLVRAAPAPVPASTASVPPSYALRTTVLVDYAGRLRHLERSVLAYRDLSPRANASEAAAAVFATLRWAEAQAAAGARCVLLPNLLPAAADPTPPAEGASAALDAALDEVEPAVADRLFRAASGREACLTEDGQGLTVLDP